MCGIVGYIGKNEAVPVLLNGLSKLEYRGYDSSGMAVHDGNGLNVRKFKGRLSVLEEDLQKNPITSHIGIGHTRWATHGEPSTVNAHPHMDEQGNIAVIHNGILENYMQLKEWLIEEHNVKFLSETDTEVIVHLVHHFYDGDLLDAVTKAVEKMEGAYAIGVICKEEPDKIVAVRKDSPLIVGRGNGENYLASDIPAILKYTKEVYLIENDETVVLTQDSIAIYDSLMQKVERDIYEVTWTADAAEKEGYAHFTLKEIYEQPKGISETIKRRLTYDDEIFFEGVHLTKEDLEKFTKIYIVACGTAYHAGLVGKRAIESLAGVPVQVDIASEFRYSNNFIDENTLFIAVSQSGETLDTLQSLREAKRRGARIMSIVNVVGSSVSRESDDVLYTWAGPEIGVASTKAFTTQLTMFYLLAMYMGKLLGQLDDAKYAEILSELKNIPDQLAEFLEDITEIQHLADSQFNNESVFFMGRAVDVDISFESSLKLKEISYINSFAIAAGELKHGTIALIEEGTLVMALATQKGLFDKMLSNIKEVKARGAYVVAVTQYGGSEIEKVADSVIRIPQCSDLLAPLLSIVPMQLFAYYVSVARGNDVDKPRNLAKSVTVE